MDDLSEVIVRSSPKRICRTLAEQLVRTARTSIKKQGSFSLFLAGGSTPRPMYELLASAFEPALQWNRVHLFWGDERFVPLDDPDSNYQMAHEAFISQLDIPDDNVHPVDTTAESVDGAAESYEQTIRQHLEPGNGDIPVCDVMLLGLGTDGHTASLFPHSSLLEEEKKLVRGVPDPPEHHDHPRVTVTFPLINHARNVWFLVTGERKRNTLHTLFYGTPSVEEHPASGVAPEGDLTWWLDDAARPVEHEGQTSRSNQ